MSLPNVNITVASGGLGAVAATADGVSGIILSGVAVSGGIQLNTPVQLFGLADANDLGITPEYDTTNSLDVYRQIADFYNQAGDGAELWLLVVAQTVKITDALNTANNHAKALLDAANGNINLLGVSRIPDEAYVPTYTKGFDDDAYNAIVKGQELAEMYAERKKPIVVIIGGRDYQGTVGALTDLKSLNAHSVAVVLAGIAEGLPDAAVGLTLGRLAAEPVQRNLGRVRSGDLGLFSAFLSDGFPVEIHENQLGAIHDKGYIAYRKFVGKAGYFFTDDPTAVAASNDLFGIARNRVINKAIRLAYNFFVNEVNDEVPYNANGTLQAGYVKGLQTGIENVLNQLMTAQNEISAASCFIDDTQNVIATNVLNVQLRIVPVGYAKSINVSLGFSNPNNNL